MAAKVTLSLKKRPAKLVGHINGRTEQHGDDPISACDLGVSDLLINREELDALCGEGTWARVFKLTRNSGMNDFPEPADFVESSKLPFTLDTKFEESKVTLHMGIDNEDKVELGNCDLARIKWAPQSGGLTLMSLQVQCNADPEHVAKIYKHLKTDIDAAVRFGRVAKDENEDQGDLPLKANGEDLEGREEA